MHIKNIHSMIEKLSEVAKCELDKGVENIDTKEMGEVAEIIKELSEAEYYAKISKAMDETEYGEDYDYMGAYDDSRKGYRGQPRSKTSGRFMSRGDGRRSNGRRGYENAMMMYDEDWEEMERMRDADRPYGRMGYSGSGSSGGSSSGMSSGGSSSGGMSSGSMGSNSGSRGYSQGNEGGQYSSRMQRDSREGRSGESRRSYMESKEMNKGNSAQEKQAKMKDLEMYLKDLSEDVSEMVSDASPEEKSMLKAKLQTLAQKVS